MLTLLRPQPKETEHLPPESDYAEEVAARIVAARKQEGLTQVELAELIGVSQRSMQGYENAEVIPYRKMKDLARVLNRPVEYFLHGDDVVLPVEQQLAELNKRFDELVKMLRTQNRKPKP